ncbi:ATP-binding protein [Natrialba swarupiae]|nr:ATP-binding protein [Natrialba swarupiae]
MTVTVGDLTSDDGFYVADDGSGIPEDDWDAVFESGYSTQQDGTGLGLAIVEEIVTTHGWDIQLAESEDGGARFEISGLDLSGQNNSTPPRVDCRSNRTTPPLLLSRQETRRCLVTETAQRFERVSRTFWVSESRRCAFERRCDHLGVRHGTGRSHSIIRLC